MSTDTHAHPGQSSILPRIFALLMGVSIFCLVGGVSLGVAAVLIH